MNNLDKFIADSAPRIEDRRVDRLIGAVMLRLDVPKQGWLDRLTDYLPRPALRYASSAVLGALVGWVIQPAPTTDRAPVQLADLFAPSAVTRSLLP